MNIISRLLNKMSGDKIYELLKITITCIFTGIIGTMITQKYKEKEQIEAREIKVQEYANVVFYDILDSASKRSFYALRVWSAIKDKGDVKSAWERYDSMVVYWNEHRARNIALIKKHFGDSMITQVRSDIYPKFVKVHSNLIDMKDGKLDPNSINFRQDIDELDSSIEDVADKMQVILRNKELSLHNGIFIYIPFMKSKTDE